LCLDAGAARALLKEGKSLLPIGVTEVRGDFERGDVLALLAPDGSEIGRGLSNYGAQEARRIAGHPTSDIEALLGYLEAPELVHRDNLVLR
jgi:glutamate 5-kinase